MPTSFAGQMNWPTEGSFKEINIEDERSRQLFESGVYVYFPSSRSEMPYWLNQEAISKMEFEVALLFSKRLQKPIIVENEFAKFKQWLIGVIADTITELGRQNNSGVVHWKVVGNPAAAMQANPVLETCNKSLRAIFGEDDLRFVWLGRKSADKVAVAPENDIVLLNLDALSTGQDLMLGTFGPILCYGEQSFGGHGIDSSLIEGICIIDEIDYHIHIDLQHKCSPL